MSARQQHKDDAKNGAMMSTLHQTTPSAGALAIAVLEEIAKHDPNAARALFIKVAQKNSDLFQALKAAGIENLGVISATPAS